MATLNRFDSIVPQAETPASAVVQASKKVQSNSAAVTSGSFHYNLIEGGQIVDQTTNDAAGNIIFPEMFYDTVGEHDYQIAEVVDNPPKPGWQYDQHYCSVHVSVTRDPVTQQLQTKVVYNPDLRPNFVNTYTATASTVYIHSKVIGHGKEVANGQFQFELVDSNGSVIAPIRNDADGNIVFPPIGLPPGDYELVIVPPEDGAGWTLDKPEVPIHITIKDNGDGTTTPIVTYPDDPNFNATYAPTPGKLQITAHKILSGWPQATKSTKQFTFVLKDENGNVVKRVQATDGVVDFGDIDLTAVGDHTYTVSEEGADGGGWTLDKNAYPVKVTVTDVGGHLVGSVDSIPSLTNTYKTADSSVDIQNKVIGHGKTPANDEFEFDVVDGDGNVIAHARNDGEGNIIFPAIDLPVGDHDLQIVAPKDGNGWTFDKPSIPVHVTVTDNGDGTSTPTITYPADPNFNATYAPTAGKLQVTAHKVLNGWPSLTKSTKLFTFVLKDENGNVVKRVESADGTVDFGEIDLTAVGVHTYTVSEEGADGEGWTLDKKAYPIDITVTDDGSGHLTGSVDRVPNLTNTYRPAPATVGTNDTPHGDKTVSGGPALKAGQFTFGLYDSNGNLVETGTNDGSGNILFPPGTFSNAGEYNFTFRETTPDGGGYTTDKTSYPYKVVVTDDGQGQLHAQVIQPTPTPIFTNTYTTAGSQSVVAHKTLQGWENGQTAPDFTFTLRDSGGQVIQTIHSNGGTLDFGVLHFTEPGDYDYTINEDPPLPAGWTTTRTSYRVHIHAEDDGHGDLITTVTYPDRDTSPQFVNTYTANTVDVGGIISDNPSGENPTKTISGTQEPLKDEQFKFGLYDESGNLVANGYSDATGRIRFPAFASSKLGDTRYTMKELTPDGSGWTTDKTAYPVDVAITDDGKGTLSATVSYPDGTPAFHNSYEAADASTVITGKVVGKGGTPGDGQFTFDVTDDDGHVVGQAHNDENGNIIFPPINLPEGEHHFHIVAPPNGDGWTFPVPSLPVDVTVTDNGDGTSTPHITYPNGDVFTPKYTPTPADVGHIISENPSGQNPTKTATGGQPLQDQQFNFGLYDENGNLIAIGANGTDGRITFPHFLSPKVGNARYTMKEVTTDGGGWTTDKTGYPVDVTVTDDGKGALSAAVSYPDGTPAFHNTYKAADALTDIVGKVVGHGKTPGDGQFEFDLTDDNGNVIGKARNDGNGNIIFPETKLPAGDYHLHMVAPPDGNGWFFDVPSLPVDVHVTDNGDGTSTGAITYPNGNTFNPQYDPIPCDIADALNDDANAARKTVVNGDPLTDMQFAFGLYDENGILVGAGFNDATGKIVFEPMPTIEEGDQTYTMKELTTDGGGWTTDKHSYPVQVHVVDEGGKLSASITWPEGKPTFVNTYYTSQDATVQINAQKTATGKPLVNGQFIFELYDVNGGILAIAENDDLGNITFPALKLPAGDYDFTMKETSPDGGGWTTDKKTVRVHVHVVDDGTGQSHAEITYPDGDPVFANVYQLRPVEVQIGASKRVCGCGCGYLCAGWFHFGLFDSTGKRVAMVSNDEDGNILIPLTFDAAGTYTYTLRELDDGTRYWKLDKRRYSVTVTVTDNGQGELVATVAYSGGNVPTFVNFYTC